MQNLQPYLQIRQLTLAQQMERTITIPAHHNMTYTLNPRDAYTGPQGRQTNFNAYRVANLISRTGEKREFDLCFSRLGKHGEFTCDIRNMFLQRKITFNRGTILKI